MRKLLQFLKKFRDFLIFIALQVFVLGLFFNSKYYHKAQMVNTSSGIVGWFVEKKYNITKHFSLEEANENLMAENAILRSRLPESYYSIQDRLYYVNDTIVDQQYNYIPALVINNTTTKRDNYITINRGRIQGVKEGMGVMTDKGAVGFVVDVSDHLATVKTLLCENINIAVKLEKNNEHGMLKWNGMDSEIVQINGITADVDIKEGDKIVTRGSKTRFPAGIPVGTVHKIESVNGKMTLNIDVKLAVDFSSVYNIYVIKNIYAEEQKVLESRIIEGYE